MQPGLPHRLLAWLFVGVAVATSATASAGDPWLPRLDDEVLQRLPAGPASRALAPYRTRLLTEPGNDAARLALAQGYLDIGRAEADPRYVSYAFTTVSPLITAERAAVPALILAATAQQYLHRFDAARQLLDQALREEPRNAQAQLIRADLLEVGGDLAAARASCARLLGSTDPLIALACLSSVASRSGELDTSYERLLAAYESSRTLPESVDGWILGILAEMAERRRDDRSRARFLQRAMQRSRRDLKLRAQYADLLIAQRDYRAVRELLHDNEDQDALLLRLAIAATREHGPGDPQAARWNAAFEERLRNLPPDAGHQREQARFLLEVRGDAPAALRAAQVNWKRQREPEDLRLLLATARAARQPEAAADARAWMAAHRYEDRTLP